MYDIMTVLYLHTVVTKIFYKFTKTIQIFLPHHPRLFCWHQNINFSTDFGYAHTHSYMRNDTFNSFQKASRRLTWRYTDIRMKQCVYNS